MCVRFFTFFLFFLAVIGCHRSISHDPDTLVIGVEAYPLTLDPRRATDALSSKITRLIYSSLFRFNEHLELVGDLAEEAHWVTNTLLEVSLRQNLVFHNGKKLTADDVAATISSIREGRVSSPFQSNFEKIKKMEVIDPYHLRFVLAEPFSPFLTSLAIGILPKEIALGEEKDFAPIGSGPYLFGQKVDNQKIVLERFDRYYGDLPQNKRLVFRTIWDDTLRTLELIKGRLDLVQNAIPPLLLPAVWKNDHLQFSANPGINFTYLGFNLRDPILKNRLVRLAIACAINRDELIRYKLKGMASPAASLLFPEHWAVHKEFKPVVFDLQKAKRLLDEAHFPDPDGDGPQTRFLLTFKTSTKKDRVEMALLIAQQLKKIGINLEVKSYEWGTFFRDIRQGDFQIYSLTWVGVTDPDIYYAAFHSSQIPPGANRGFYENRELDALVEEARKERDIERRKMTYQRVQEIVYNDFVYVPLWHENNWVVATKVLRGYSLRPDAGFWGLIHAFKKEVL